MDNKKIPWHDLATSRRLILADDGPFGSSHLRIKEGLFSALLYRGITHNSQFLHTEQHIFFDGLDDWEMIYATSKDVLEDSNDMDQKEIEKYFCDGCAYGVWTRRRVNYAPTYAAATEAPDLTSWLLNAEFPTFMEVYKLFHKGKVNGTSAFPGFGPLQAYLLASDYVIAGAVKMPTYEEMGELLWSDLKQKGAMSGLWALGYDDFESAEDVAAAFEEMDKMLTEAIPENLRHRMNYNVFTTEHILCKVQRLNIAQFKKMLKAHAKLSPVHRKS
ncbi:hypothetical protein CPB85DRAFT_1436729 [Mucidula mucida]|nr:hypothetical protein CPB85DRAFT_1436729 [Mucidula mucida]